MLAGPRKYKPQRKKYLRKNPNSEAAVPAVEGGRKPGRLPGGGGSDGPTVVAEAPSQCSLLCTYSPRTTPL